MKRTVIDNMGREQEAYAINKSYTMAFEDETK